MEFALALPPNTDQAFLREVDDELRRDQALQVWQRWGRWIIAAIVVGLVALAAVLWWRQHDAEKAGEQGEQFTAAFKDLGDQNFDKANKTLTELAGSDRAGYRAVAKFTQADILLQKKNEKGAAAKFAEVANDSRLPQPFRDLALIRQTAAEYDALKPEVVIDRLGKLAVKDSPWFGSAGEMVAIAYLRQGKKALAGKMFGEIGETDGVPQTIRQRAVQMAGVLGVDAIDQSEEKKAR
jgi:hypothetical protein